MKNFSIKTNDLIHDLLNGTLDLEQCVETPIFITAFKLNHFDVLSTSMDITPLCIVIDNEILNDEIYLKLKRSHMYSTDKLGKELANKLKEYSSQTNNGEMIPTIWRPSTKGVGAFSDEMLAWDLYYSQHLPLIEYEEMVKEKLIQIRAAKDYLGQRKGAN